MLRSDCCYDEAMLTFATRRLVVLLTYSDKFFQMHQMKTYFLESLFRRLYWSDWGKENPKIESSNLDGSNRTTLISENIKWPNGVALDYKRRLLYWVDAGTDKIEYYNLVDKKRYKLTVGSPHAFGISVLGDMLYWTDWQQRALFQWNINTKKQEKV